jgi:hypothetical protein
MMSWKEFGRRRLLHNLGTSRHLRKGIVENHENPQTT